MNSTDHHRPRKQALARNLLLAVLLTASMPACTAEKAPNLQVFDTPAAEITSFTRIPFESKDHFGAAVSLEGDTLAIGAPVWGYPGKGAGSAYVYTRSAGGEWVLASELAASDRDDGFQYDQHFGEAVALNGRLLAVGAPGYDDRQAGDNTGAVYLFEFDGAGWVEKAVLQPANKIPAGRMGSSVAFFGDLLVMTGSPKAGTAATFRRQGESWVELKALEIPSAKDGAPVYILPDIYGSTLALSAAPWPEPEMDQGEDAVIKSLARKASVTLYELKGETWKEVYQYPVQEASLFRIREDAPFGMPVSLGGEDGAVRWLAIGKPGFTGSARERGSVLILEKTQRGWQPQAELMLAAGEAVPGGLPFFGSDPGPVFFGSNVEMDGKRLAVISAFANTVYLFEHQEAGWVYQARMTPGAAYMDDFMRRVAVINGSSVVLGSPGELGGGNVLEFALPE